MDERVRAQQRRGGSRHGRVQGAPPRPPSAVNDGPQLHHHRRRHRLMFVRLWRKCWLSVSCHPLIYPWTRCPHGKSKKEIDRDIAEADRCLKEERVRYDCARPLCRSRVSI